MLDKLKKLQDLDQKQQYAVFGGALLLFFLLDYFIIMYPQLAWLRKLNPQISIMSTDIAATHSNIQKLPQYQKEIAGFREELAVLDRKIKSKQETQIITERISRIANQNGITVDQMMPNMQAEEEVLSNSERIFYKLPIFVEMRCGYHNFGKFLNEIEQEEVMSVTDFVIESNTLDARKHIARLTLNVIIFENKQ